MHELDVGPALQAIEQFMQVPSIIGVISRTRCTVNSVSRNERTRVCCGGSVVEHDVVGSHLRSDRRR